MSKDADSGSLFDLAKKLQKKKGQEPAKKEEGKGPAATITPSSAQIISAKASPEERQSTFERMKKMHDEIQNKIEQAFESAKISPRQIKTYTENPTHFPAKDWEEIQKTKKVLKEKLEQLVPGTLLAKEGEEGAPEVSEKEKLKKAKSGLLSRRRWLSTH
mgnify:CR=1 FL=1